MLSSVPANGCSGHRRFIFHSIPFHNRDPELCSTRNVLSGSFVANLTLLLRLDLNVLTWRIDTQPLSLFRIEFFLTRLLCALCYRTCDQGIDLWVVSVSGIKSHFTQPEMYYLLLRFVCLQVFCCFFNPFPDHNQS